MKVKIIGKYIKEGEAGGRPYCIKTIRCSVDTSEAANQIAEIAIKAGATIDQARKVISKKEYEGKTSFAFYINCSDYTFEKIEQYGILDCDFEATAKGDFVNFKIKVVDRIEQVNGYESPEQQVRGWANTSAEPTPTVNQAPEPIGHQSNPFLPPKDGVNVNSLEPQAGDLPF